jgi:uncharacterized protein YkwD
MKKFITYIFLFFTFFTYSQNVDSIQFYFLEIINEYRISKGVDKLEIDSNLTDIAQNHANYIHYEVVKNFNDEGYSHIQKNKENPYYVGKYLSDRLDNSGENICKYRDIKEKSDKLIATILFNKWKDSKNHNENMLNPSFKKMGIGFKFDKIQLEKYNKTENGFVVLLLN